MAAKTSKEKVKNKDEGKKSSRTAPAPRPVRVTRQPVTRCMVAGCPVPWITYEAAAGAGAAALTEHYRTRHTRDELEPLMS
jgi:hypothetical protein